ncbi:hypothetical protein B0H67DRAFT_580065 [Lasiosphaeris hirsuta]|uniref:Uncharacterized protein n=1 Tax=Lasiosphaeris hirsuta TaxID=260670 RepID=A0AA40AG45_9PEZI|nr:hypothetical protein B0H67DRAFT_580065 [Lasiosphaeris hirsuta]
MTQPRSPKSLLDAIESTGRVAILSTATAGTFGPDLQSHSKSRPNSLSQIPYASLTAFDIGDVTNGPIHPTQGVPARLSALSWSSKREEKPEDPLPSQSSGKAWTRDMAPPTKSLATLADLKGQSMLAFQLRTKYPREIAFLTREPCRWQPTPHIALSALCGALGDPPPGVTAQ